MQNFFYVKLSCPKTPEDRSFERLLQSIFDDTVIDYDFLNIPNRLSEAKVGDFVFLQLGGDSGNKRSYFSEEHLKNFENGMYGLVVIKELFDIDKRFIGTVYPFKSEVTKLDLYLYPQFIDSIGGITKGIPNQAGLYGIETDVAYSFLDYLETNSLLPKSSTLFSLIDFSGSLKKGVNQFFRENTFKEKDSFNDFLEGIELKKDEGADLAVNYSPQQNFIIKSFVNWFHEDSNYKKSYDGLIKESVLKFWDKEFFNFKLFKFDDEDLIRSVEFINSMIQRMNNDSSWESFNLATSKGAPKAILGTNNYGKFLNNFLDNAPLINKYSQLNISNNSSVTPKASAPFLNLPKPFLLLAGISGTGKSRFVRTQAYLSNGLDLDSPEKVNNYELVAVRPDWHEPSDLLGYTSRIKEKDTYVATSFLKFLIKAWQEVFDHGGSLEELKEGTRPFWLCLDEMNLAPVEQYFADYLSILESRKWRDDKYSCLNLISEDLDLVREVLSSDYGRVELWEAFEKNEGIPIPPNLIVAGTVNMDETTHAFSRKVIDRALTLDFQEFFRNDFDQYFTPQSKPKVLGFSTITHIASVKELPKIDQQNGNSRSLEFLKNINKVLEGTNFELAYRALNELLLSVKCFEPKNESGLSAVWDDFLMQKVLPRIEGDSDKLAVDGDEFESGLLAKLKAEIEEQFKNLLGKKVILKDAQQEVVLGEDLDIEETEVSQRPDLLSETVDGDPVECNYRSLKKIDWMMERLQKNQYTSFWA